MTQSKLDTAYSVCRDIARREARNFYYSFLALPRAKRDALSAVYAFMRHADDISDDEGTAAPERRRKLSAWLAAWRGVQEGGYSDNPVFIALADTQHRYNIPEKLLDQLVEGTSMDIESSLEQGANGSGGGGAAVVSAVRVHRTFTDLYRYCYLVASVVGLVCIRIYGYEDARAESLAERCGVAFQLTNIIRDVKEDAAMGRAYLPEEDLSRFGLTLSDFLEGGGSRLEQSRLLPLLEFEAQRAREYYEAADELIPLIHEDSRSALWVMVTIYRSLLDRIAARNFNVLQGKIRLSSTEKLTILGRGIAKSLLHGI